MIILEVLETLEDFIKTLDKTANSIYWFTVPECDQFVSTRSNGDNYKDDWLIRISAWGNLIMKENYRLFYNDPDYTFKDVVENPQIGIDYGVVLTEIDRIKGNL